MEVFPDRALKQTSPPFPGTENGKMAREEIRRLQTEYQHAIEQTPLMSYVRDFNEERERPGACVAFHGREFDSSIWLRLRFIDEAAFSAAIEHFKNMAHHEPKDFK